MSSPGAPFPPLVPGGEGLEQPPAFPEALRRRMAEVYGVPAECVLPIRGVTHGLELVLRWARRDGETAIAASNPTPELIKLARLYALPVSPDPQTGGAVVAATPTDIAAGERALLAGQARLLVVDEQGVEFEETPSLAPLAGRRDDLIVLRSLSLAYGLAGAPCGALIGSASTVEAFRSLLEPFALSTPIVRLAEAALSPSRALATEARIALIRSERARMAAGLEASSQVSSVSLGRANRLELVVTDPESARGGLARYRAAHSWEGDALTLYVGAPEANDRALAALGAATSAKPHRRAEVIRDTKETKITVAIDLDAEAPRRARTGIGFYDHMLDQIAAHAGFALVLACEGDLEIDAHHTIEDCALALGAGLKQALGDRRGIGRFGFVLPMDETEAKVSIDLGGRPYAVFEGEFKASHIGDWPTEMTPHVFRSLAESLGAAIHISVTGENDHHKTEACFKAFGRAMRQAIRVEGDAVPSTKGVL
jgi:imidazoleglycerol phosphate dehydratase HisB